MLEQCCCWFIVKIYVTITQRKSAAYACKAHEGMKPITTQAAKLKPLHSKCNPLRYVARLGEPKKNNKTK